MKSGISPIVAVVLLITIAVVSAVGLYFWAGGLATKQITPHTPISINAFPLEGGVGKIAVANLGDSPLTISQLERADGGACVFADGTVIQPSQMAVCTDPAPARGSSTYFTGGSGSVTVVYDSDDIEPVVFSATGFTTASWSSPWSGTFTNTTNGSILLDTHWLKETVNSEGGNQTDSSIAIDSNDLVHIAWEDPSDIFYANSSGWIKQTLISAPDVQSNPSIAVDSNDVLHAVWQWKIIGDEDIYYSNSSDGWSQNLINNAGSEQLEPDIAIDDYDTVHLTWYGNKDGDYDIYYANSSSGWTEVTVKNSATSLTEPCIAVDSNNVSHIAWIATAGPGSVSVNYANSSSNWAVVTMGGGSYSSNPDIAVDTNDVVHITWSARDANDYEVYYANSSSGWTVVKVTDDETDQYDPTIAIDNNDVVHIAWWASDTLVDRNIYYANSSSGWTEETVNKDADNQWRPSIATDSNNEVHISWEGNSGGSYDIYYGNSTYYYYTTGTFLSDYIDTDYSPANFTKATWTNSTPTDTTFEMKFQFSNTSDFASHVNVTATTSPQTNLNSANRYVRYWVNMTTTNQSVTPSLSAFTMKYRAVNGNLTYTVNSDDSLSFVQLNSSCYAGSNPIVNESASGRYYTNTITNRTDCTYTVWGPNVNTMDYP